MSLFSISLHKTLVKWYLFPSEFNYNKFSIRWTGVWVDWRGVTALAAFQIVHVQIFRDASNSAHRYQRYGHREYWIPLKERFFGYGIWPWERFHCSVRRILVISNPKLSFKKNGFCADTELCCNVFVWEWKRCVTFEWKNGRSFHE